MKRVRSIIGMVFLLAMPWPSNCKAQSDVSPQSGSPVPIAARISKNLIQDLTRQQIEMSFPIDRNEGGAQISGNAGGSGVLEIKFLESNDQARFNLTIDGTAYASFRARSHPVTVVAQTNAQFSTMKYVRFDGTDFVFAPATSQTCNQTEICRVCTNCQGLGGKVVRRVATKIICRNKCEIDQAVQKATADMISSSFDSRSESLQKQLNDLMMLDENLGGILPMAENWQMHLATGQDHLIAGIGPPDAQLPDFAAIGTPESSGPIEVWIQLNDLEAALVETVIGDWEVAHDLLREFLPEEQAQQLAEDLKIERRREWSILFVGAKN